MKQAAKKLLWLGAAAGLGVALRRRRRRNVVGYWNGSEILRTPDARFEGLPGYPFAPNYAYVDGLRMHYVDEGPRHAPAVLMLHGEPSWSYLYRKMIPRFTAAGLRALAPDLIGFGKSDKLASRRSYSYQQHVDWLWAWVEKMDLENITLVCQDWGSLIGLRLVAEHPERFARVVLANGALPTGDETLPDVFKAWVFASQALPVLPIGQIIQGGTETKLSEEVVRAYGAPFPSEAYKAGARVFPKLVPTRPDDPAGGANRRAWAALERFDKPFLTAFSDGDPIMRGSERVFQRRVPGAQGQAHRIIRGGGHFLQEDRGEVLAQVVLDFIESASPQRQR